MAAPACRSAPTGPESAPPAAVTLTISDARAERTSDGSRIAISCTLMLDNPTGDYLYIPSTASSPFAGFRLAVGADDGSEIAKLEQARPEAVGEAARRTFILAKGLTTERAMSFSLNDPERRLQRLTLQAVGDLGPAPAVKGLASNRLSVNVAEPASEPRALPKPPSAPSALPPAQPEAAPTVNAPAPPAAPPATPTDAAPAARGTPPEKQPKQTVSFTAMYVPAMKLFNDEDPTEPENIGSFDDGAEVRWGTGIGGRLSPTSWTGGNANVGFLVLASRHTEHATRGPIHAVQGYVEVFAETTPTPGWIQFTAGGGFGVGAIFIEMPGDFHDTGGLAAEMRGSVGATIFHHVELRAGPAFFLWGYPSETLGYGMMVLTEAGLVF